MSCLAIRMQSCTALQRISRKLRRKTVHQQKGRGLYIYLHAAISLTAIVSVQLHANQIETIGTRHQPTGYRVRGSDL